jgi:hypothetical protein
MRTVAIWAELLVVGAITISPTPSSAVALDFEDVAPNTQVTTEFAAKGILFGPGSLVQTDTRARSGTRVVLPVEEPLADCQSACKVDPVSALKIDPPRCG